MRKARARSAGRSLGLRDESQLQKINICAGDKDYDTFAGQSGAIFQHRRQAHGAGGFGDAAQRLPENANGAN